jgi:hypothetical protein
MTRTLLVAALAACLGTMTPPARAQILDKQRLLDRQSFWDNRDWDWYRANIPFFECPDPEVETTWYYRWELVTKHLTYGSPNSGYACTEFIDRPFWSGAYGAISCPAGHQLYEVRWLHDPRYSWDYARYWFRVPGAQPRRYSTWLADAVWDVHRVHPDETAIKDLLPDMIRNYEGWEKEHFVPEVGLFWQTGHDDGMEININSRQTRDTVRGAPGYRPTLNAYLWADALAIARAADQAGDADTAKRFRDKAASLKKNLQNKLWDERRQFFLHMYMQDEVHDGHLIKALTRTYETGKYAGSDHGRELIGYVPWQFSLPDRGYEQAWKFLMDRDYFLADFGPTTVERHDPQFLISKTCCVWSGQSWPYATSQTLKALANLLQEYEPNVVTKGDYYKLLSIYTKTHRKDGRPYIAEAAHPDTGSWEGHDAFNHSEHYFHSSYCDLVVTGLVGIRPLDDDVLEVRPLAPDSWDYFALDDLPYKGRRVSVVWDKRGSRYGLGAGLHLVADGTRLASADRLKPLTARLPPAQPSKPLPTRVNFAVNNDGRYYPRITASYTAPGTSTAKLIDGNYWYHAAPPNRWTCEGSPNRADWLEIDFGVPRRIDTVKLYVLDDGETIVPPAAISLRIWSEETWKDVAKTKRRPSEPLGRRANWIEFDAVETRQIRIELTHQSGAASGLSEMEAWGQASLPVAPAPPPKDNLAYRAPGEEFPKAAASHTSRFDKVEMANDGIVSFAPAPHNRWTSYESKTDSDWLEIDFGSEKEVARVEMAIYDDRGGVQAPRDYAIELWRDGRYVPASHQQKSPAKPTGGQFNEVRFDKVKTTKLRVVFTHALPAKSGVSEILIWAS